MGKSSAVSEESAGNSNWTVDTLREHFESLLTEHKETADNRLADLRAMLDERYATQTKALDAAFKAAEQAVQTALASQEKAVSKAEAAADKRFEAVNEFRQQLSDQTASFPTRAEVGSRMDALAKDIARNTESQREMELRLTSRLDTITGGTAGAAATRSEQRLNIGATVAVVGAILTAAAIIVTILIATGH